MNSHIALIGSIVIGGLFLLGVMNFYGGMVDHSTEKGIELRTQQTAANLVDIMEYDFRRMGSGMPTPSIAIESYTDSTDITFNADLDGDGQAESVRYYIEGAAGSTENPNDFILCKTINGTETLRIAGVRQFGIKLRDMASSLTTNPANVSMVQIYLLMESTYSYRKDGFSDDLYARSLWRKLITPKSMIRQTSMDFD